jgi:hypothetical protein
MANTLPVPHFFSGWDDQKAEPGRNGLPAIASLIADYARVLNDLNYSGRTVYEWWGGDGTANSDNILRWLWDHHHLGGSALRGRVLFLPHYGTRAAGQGIRIGINRAGETHDTTTDYTLTEAATEPEGLTAVDVGADIDHAATGSRIENELGSVTTNGPGLIAGCMYEQLQSVVDPSSNGALVPEEGFRPGASQVAVSPSSGLTNLERLRAMFNHCWYYRRPIASWSIVKPGTNYVDFTTAKTSYRYIFDQTYGDGGIGIGATTPGITLPLYASAAGLRTQIRVAVYVYAAMSGATNTGSLAVANKDGAGDMGTGTPAALTNPVSISGTTFKWYSGTGAGNADPSALTGAPSYFLGDCYATYDRVVLCAKSSGSTDSVRIAAFALVPFHFTG